MSTAAQNCVRRLRCLAAHRPAKFGCRKLPATVRCPHFHPGLAAVPSRWSQTEPRSARVQTHTSAQTSTECSSFERTRVPSIEFPCPFFYGATPVYTFFLLTLGRNPFRNKHPGSSCNLFTNGCYSSGTAPSEADYAALWGCPRALVLRTMSLVRRCRRSVRDLLPGSLGTLPRELSRDDGTRPSFPIQSGHAANPGRFGPERSAATPPQSPYAADRGIPRAWLGDFTRCALVLSQQTAGIGSGGANSSDGGAGAAAGSQRVIATCQRIQSCCRLTS